jgi:hypothetical protein
MDAHPEFVIPTPASITKRVVGSLLSPEVRAAFAVETGGREQPGFSDRQREETGNLAPGDGYARPVARSALVRCPACGERLTIRNNGLPYPFGGASLTPCNCKGEKT